MIGRAAPVTAHDGELPMSSLRWGDLSDKEQPHVLLDGRFDGKDAQNNRRVSQDIQPCLVGLQFCICPPRGSEIRCINLVK